MYALCKKKTTWLFLLSLLSLLSTYSAEEEKFQLQLKYNEQEVDTSEEFAASTPLEDLQAHICTQWGYYGKKLGLTHTDQYRFFLANVKGEMLSLKDTKVTKSQTFTIGLKKSIQFYKEAEMSLENEKQKKTKLYNEIVKVKDEKALTKLIQDQKLPFLKNYPFKAKHPYILSLTPHLYYPINEASLKIQWNTIRFVEKYIVQLVDKRENNKNEFTGKKTLLLYDKTWQEIEKQAPYGGEMPESKAELKFIAEGKHLYFQQKGKYFTAVEALLQAQGDIIVEEGDWLLEIKGTNTKTNCQILLNKENLTPAKRLKLIQAELVKRGMGKYVLAVGTDREEAQLLTKENIASYHHYNPRILTLQLYTHDEARKKWKNEELFTTIENLPTSTLIFNYDGEKITLAYPFYENLKSEDLVEIKQRLKEKLSKQGILSNINFFFQEKNQTSDDEKDKKAILFDPENKKNENAILALLQRKLLANLGKEKKEVIKLVLCQKLVTIKAPNKMPQQLKVGVNQEKQDVKRIKRLVARELKDMELDPTQLAYTQAAQESLQNTKATSYDLEVVSLDDAEDKKPLIESEEITVELEKKNNGTQKAQFARATTTFQEVKDKLNLAKNGSFYEPNTKAPYRLEDYLPPINKTFGYGSKGKKVDKDLCFLYEETVKYKAPKFVSLKNKNNLKKVAEDNALPELEEGKNYYFYTLDEKNQDKNWLLTLNELKNARKENKKIYFTPLAWLITLRSDIEKKERYVLPFAKVGDSEKDTLENNILSAIKKENLFHGEKEQNWVLYSPNDKIPFEGNIQILRKKSPYHLALHTYPNIDFVGALENDEFLQKNGIEGITEEEKQAILEKPLFKEKKINLVTYKTNAKMPISNKIGRRYTPTDTIGDFLQKTDIPFITGALCFEREEDGTILPEKIYEPGITPLSLLNQGATLHYDQLYKVTLKEGTRIKTHFVQGNALLPQINAKTLNTKRKPYITEERKGKIRSYPLDIGNKQPVSQWSGIRPFNPLAQDDEGFVIDYSIHIVTTYSYNTTISFGEINYLSTPLSEMMEVGCEEFKNHSPYLHVSHMSYHGKEYPIQKGDETKTVEEFLKDKNQDELSYLKSQKEPKIQFILKKDFFTPPVKIGLTIVGILLLVSSLVGVALKKKKQITIFLVQLQKPKQKTKKKKKKKRPPYGKKKRAKNQKARAKYIRNATIVPEPQSAEELL